MVVVVVWREGVVGCDGSVSLTSLQASEEQEATPEEVVAGDRDPCEPWPETSLVESVSTSSSGGSSHMEKKRGSFRNFGADS